MRAWGVLTLTLSLVACLEVRILETPAPRLDEGPRITFQASAAQVAFGEGVYLRWEAVGMARCRAEGDWTGPRALAGAQWVGPLTEDGHFLLVCETVTGAQRQAQVQVAVRAAQGALTGWVDGHWLTGNGPFQVQLSPVGAEVPVATVPVTSVAPCRYRYRFEGLPAGTYRLQLLRGEQALAQWTVTVEAAGTILDLAPAATVVRVGPDGEYPTPAAAAAAVGDDTVVEIAAGEYLDDIAVWRQSRLTLRAVGGPVQLRATRLIPHEPGNDAANGKGIWVLRGDDIRIEGITFQGARVPDENGAGIRIDPPAERVTLCATTFIDNENGLLGSANDLRIEYSRFLDNGIQDDGYTHNLYLSDGDRVVFYASQSLRARSGHLLKSRARRTEILYSELADRAEGTASYAVDVPQGGELFILGSVLHKGPKAENPALVSYGNPRGVPEDGRPHRITLIHNTLVNRNAYGGEVFLQLLGASPELRLFNNLWLGPAMRFGGTEPAQMAAAGNVEAGGEAVRDADAFDFRLVPGSPAVDAGTALAPLGLPAPRWQRETDSSLRPRTVLGAAPDAGAFELR